MICPPLSPCGPASTAPPIPNILYHDLFIRTSTKRALKIRTLWSSEIQFGAPLRSKQSSQVGGGSLRPVIFSLVYTIVMRVWLMMSVVPAKVSCLFTLRSADEEEENWPAMIYRSRFLIRWLFLLVTMWVCSRPYVCVIIIVVCVCVVDRPKNNSHWLYKQTKSECNGQQQLENETFWALATRIVSESQFQMIFRLITYFSNF